MKRGGRPVVRTHSVEVMEPRVLLTAGMVADLQRGSADASPSVLTAGTQRLYFRATDGTSVGNEPYLTDGTPSGTARLKDINPRGDSIYYNLGSGQPSPPTTAVPFGDGFFFTAYDEPRGLELYYTALHRLSENPLRLFIWSVHGDSAPPIAWSVRRTI